MTSASTVAERLVSADSHVSVTHDQVKANLDPRLHDAYDTAQQAFAERVRPTPRPCAAIPTPPSPARDTATGRSA